MREDFLHFLWRTRRFDARALQTTDQQPIVVLQQGDLNTHAGPDFFNARVRVGETEWAGNVEMHLNASDWRIHGHQTDAAYDNVILHVVWEADADVQRLDGTNIPCVSLKGRVDERLLDLYRQLESDTAWIPCAHRLREVPEIVRLNWYDRLLVERIESKTAYIAAQLEASGMSWEEAFYRTLARSFGLKVNAEPFEALARSIPLLTLAKHKNNPMQLEALLFGQAGMLEQPMSDSYSQALAKEYHFLKHKYQLMPMEVSQWKFLRLRPANFPSVRIAQFAALVQQSAHLFSKILEAKTLRELEHLFNAEVGPYWLTHYQFDKPSKARSKRLGKDFVHLLLINTIVPCLFHYGRSRQQPQYEDKALELLDQIPAETNSILDQWASIGAPARTAVHSQALLHLKSQYCDARRCLSCAVGVHLLK